MPMLRMLNFRHLKGICKSARELCQRCVDPMNSTDWQCPRTQLQSQCKNCNKSRIATDKCREERKRQQNIRDYAMENNISIPGAGRITSGRNRYTQNANEYPFLSTRCSPLQESPIYEATNILL
ncbi:hypothetical protein QAD02_003713 [Eretmocerus hayati]|uniref:Uncharacterized protein n=1 Tax=Eretmocerus hayati TaxID=131215 RepID=A0ACC2NQ63_9HYME|nr:hypothetical protein QAD02_003713 [Eretmocerus hayati]